MKTRFDGEVKSCIFHTVSGKFEIVPSMMGLSETVLPTSKREVKWK